VNVDGGYVKVDFNADLALNPAPDKSFSVEAWVLPEWSDMEQDVFRCVVASREDTGAEKHGYILYAGPILDPIKFTTTDATMHWQAWVGDGTTWLMLVGPTVEVGQPTYLLLTYDGAAQSLTLDAIINPGPNTSPPPRLSKTAIYSPNPGKPLYIGMGATEIMVPPGQPLYPFRGRLQEIAFYNAVLTTQQVANHLAAATTILDG
jgi:Concanavalin A-like lectin/glucanases superfamily